MSNQLDQLVKGAPSPNTSVSSVAAAAVSPSSPSRALAAELHEAKKPSLNRPPAVEEDPMSLIPSSPPQIYLNLLILEASLRSQYLTLRARRRQHTFFFGLLAVWNIYFLYALFFRPREDGKGIGGSPYWVVDMGEKVAFMGGVLTAVLMWATGQLERGLRWPRRWVAVTNRGLRCMNLKIVVLRGAWWRRVFEQLSLLFPYNSIFGRSQGSDFRVVDLPSDKRAPAADSARPDARPGEEDIAPGGDAIKLLLLPKQFSPEFRENWEMYRTEYWERENERRAGLRQLVRARERDIAKAHGGWLWWTGWRGWRVAAGGKWSGEADKTAHGHAHGHAHAHSHHQHTLQRPARDARKRRPSGAHGDGSNSRSSSRSSTVTPEAEEQRAGGGSARGQHRRHKSSNLSMSAMKASTGAAGSSSSSSRREASLAASQRGKGEGAGASAQRTLDKRASMLSTASSDDANDSEVSERSTTSTGAAVARAGAAVRQRDIAMSDGDA